MGITWRAGHDLFGAPAAVAELILGSVSLLFIFFSVSYLAKLRLRRGVLLEDLRPLPGRIGLAALTMGTMLFGAALVPYTPVAAGLILTVGLGFHLLLIFYVLVQLVRRPDIIGPVSPALYLVFAGVAVSPVAAIPLGRDLFVQGILYYSTAAAFVILVLTLPGMFRRTTPAPLRPLHVIHLAPVSLIAAGAAHTGQGCLALAALGWACLLFFVLLCRLRWIVSAGFSPFWGSFTFPVAAFAGAWVAIHSHTEFGVPPVVPGCAIILATLVIPPIAYRILRQWADGSLAARTNAGIA